MKFSSWLLLLLGLLVIYSSFKCHHRAEAPKEEKIDKPLENANTNTIRAGIHKKRYSDGQVYYLYIPKTLAINPNLATDIVAVIHGYTGQKHGGRGHNITLRNLKRFINYADRRQTILIAPHFDENIFDADYQRLNLRGTRADIRLIDLVHTTQSLFPNIRDTRLKMFGFSGGGQFVHRFCALHPQRIVKAVASGAGWYTWPDITLDYPLGTNLDNYTNVGYIDLNKWTQCPLLILVGEDDLRQGSFRTEYQGVDLNAMQGDYRVDRARNWVSAMHTYAQSQGITPNISLQAIPGTPHRTTNDLMNAAYLYLSSQ